MVCNSCAGLIIPASFSALPQCDRLFTSKLCKEIRRNNTQPILQKSKESLLLGRKDHTPRSLCHHVALLGVSGRGAEGVPFLLISCW